MPNTQNDQTTPLESITATQRLRDTILAFRAEKPTEAGELARRYAIVLTQLELIEAYARVNIEKKIPV